MKKITLNTLLFVSANLALIANSQLLAKDNNCQTLVKEIAQLEKDLLHKNKLLAHQKQELEKLPPEATSAKMKLTSDSFVTAAESETAQNWIEVKRKEKIKSCGK